MYEQSVILSIGHVLEGRYRIISEGLARDIGTEYKAYDLRRERLAVVVVLAPHLGGGPAVAERLVTTNQAVADLTELALVPYDRIGLWHGQFYVARRHVEAMSLADLLAARAGSLSVEAVVDLGIRLSEALAPAHRAGLVHGGLSPDSVLVGDGGEVYLLDTGLMPALCSPATPASPGMIWGRLPYLSPEQAAGREALPASDVYVAGSLIYHMLASRPPFAALDLSILAVQHLRQDPPSLPVLVPNVPPALAQIVHKALAKEPSARYRNAGQLAHVLRAQFRPATTAASQPAFVPPSPQPTLASPAHQAWPTQPMVVPPPPAAYAGRQPPEAWGEEREKMDWLLVALIVVALVAVLGLIPLWRTVYRLYSVPASPAAPAPSGQLEGALGVELAGASGYHRTCDLGPVHRSPTSGGYPAGARSMPGKQTPKVSSATVLVQGAGKLVASDIIWYNPLLRAESAKCWQFGSPAYGAGHSL